MKQYVLEDIRNDGAPRTFGTQEWTPFGLFGSAHASGMLRVHRWNADRSDIYVTVTQHRNYRAAVRRFRQILRGH